MKRYDHKKVMTEAWRKYNRGYGDISECLKDAWRLHKKEVWANDPKIKRPERTTTLLALFLDPVEQAKQRKIQYNI